MRGEVRDTLDLLQRRGTALVLGLRDVMDDPRRSRASGSARTRSRPCANITTRSGSTACRRSAIRWPASRCRASVRERMVYTGYLRRTAGELQLTPEILGIIDSEFLLVTPGGGGDGEALIDWVLAAYEHDRGIPHSGPAGVRPVHAARAAGGVRARAARLDERAGDHLRRPAREADGARRRRRRDGRLQHLLRDPVVRQAGADRAAHRAAAGAVHPGAARRRARPVDDAVRGRRPRPARDGGGAAPPGAPAAALGGP